MSELTDDIRRVFKEGDDIRDEGLTTPEGVIRHDDIAYGPDAAWQVMDLYLPEGAKGPLPVIVSVHGGAWVYGDKERYQWYCMDLALRGFAVVNFTYRLAPDFKFPSSLEDACLVFSWVLDHAKEYGLDTSKVFAVGDSAGAPLLGLFSNLCTNPAYAAKVPVKAPEGFAPAAVALNCGQYHTELDDPEELTAQLMAEYLPEKGTDEELDLIEVVGYVTPAFPPAYVMTCEADFLHDQAAPLAQALRDAEVSHELHVYCGVGDKLGHVFHLNMKSGDARRCNDDECAFFKRFL